MVTEEGSFEMVSDLPGEQFGEPISYQEVEMQASLMGKRVRILGPRGSRLIGMTGDIVDAHINKFATFSVQVYRVKLHQRLPSASPDADEGIWHREEDLEVIP